MISSHTPLLVRFLPVSCAVLLSFAPLSPTAQAADYCTDIPACSDGKVLVFIDDDKREDCAKFTCSLPALADSLGRRVTPEMLARFKEEPKISCEDGKTAVKLKKTPAGRENSWVCATPMLANYYTNNNMIAETSHPDSTTPSMRCNNNRMLVRYKTKPQNAETSWACINRNIYKTLSDEGLLVEE